MSEPAPPVLEKQRVRQVNLMSFVEQAVQVAEIAETLQVAETLQAVEALQVAETAETVQVAEIADATEIAKAAETVVSAKLHTENLDLFYGNFQALHKVNLAIPPLSITAFIGPSGCGKTTLLKTFNRMNDLVEGCRIEGDVLLDGDEIYGNMDVNHLRKRVGMVFQKPNPFPMSVYDNIAFGPRTHGIRRKGDLDEIVERSLRDAALFDELKDRLRHNALGLSGGQQQRLCIARALAAGPEVLLMDEPTSALDPASTAHIEELAIKLAERYTIVIVTHNMQQAARISDRTAFFLLGEIVECDTTAKIFSKPGDSRTEDYIRGRFG